jgi:tetratricopeptide (TPR) repeat protein
VSESSGCLDSAQKIPLQRTHFDINKFGKSTDEEYLTVCDIIIEMVDAAATSLSPPQGNIKGHVDQASVRAQDYVTSPRIDPIPPLFPPELQSNDSSSYPVPHSPEPTQKVIGLRYPSTGSDPKSIQVAEHKNKGHWDQAQLLEQQIFQEHQRSLGSEHISTLTAAFNLAATYLELGLVDDAAKWQSWVSSISKRTLGAKHPLSMEVESLNGEILREKGQYQEAETICANVFVHQQDILGDDHLDTLLTQRRLGSALYSLGRNQDALTRLEKRTEILTKILGECHIQVFASVLDLVEVMIPPVASDLMGVARFSSEVQQASKIVPPIYQDLRDSLGPQNQVTIRALRIYGTVKILEGKATEASDILRRSLSNAEDLLGPDHPETLNIVAVIGILYSKQDSLSYVTGGGSPQMRPWLQRYLGWLEKRKGSSHPETQGVLSMLAMSYMSAKEYADAETYYERLLNSYRGQNSKAAEQANNMLQLCQMNTMYTKRLRPNNGSDISNLLSRFGFQGN